MGLSANFFIFNLLKNIFQTVNFSRGFWPPDLSKAWKWSNAMWHSSYEQSHWSKRSLELFFFAKMNVHFDLKTKKTSGKNGKHTGLKLYQKLLMGAMVSLVGARRVKIALSMKILC